MASPELAWVKQKVADDRGRAGVSGDRHDPVAARASLPETRLPLPEGLEISQLQAGDVTVYRVQAREAGSDRAVLHLHGGGFSAGGFGSHRTLAGWLSEFSGATVLFPEYRLAPEHRFPAGLEDCFAAYEFALSEDPRELFVTGDSAGGALGISVFQMARDRGLRVPDGLVVICGMLDLDEERSTFLQMAQRTRDNVRLYVERLSDLKHPLASAMEADLTGLPPLLIQTGSEDYCADECERFAAKAKAAGAAVGFENWPEMVHVWHRFAPKLPEANDALKRIAAWMDEVGGRDA
ncbi:MAG: alpha/beta hydrolase [Boseongicola sp. SB0676_bin_33]|uniref:Alpha/beta hydrolase n=1 Tax=Boseongicola sp. SB0664_bin_43 TaxID=2604844 RepID=A0A6B0Y4D6_9RHOB|nr:alpha/beta hydrolase [Boseongicola sp. SB0664_bin_43]MYF89044.1 alpha/beta hydrolase [Boseongicola sp. SB0676_bin_33]MYK31120.1 alpha/beta hydrolase [Boseongicola sp. SB0670_bin_30]